MNYDIELININRLKKTLLLSPVFIVLLFISITIVQPSLAAQPSGEMRPSQAGGPQTETERQEVTQKFVDDMRAGKIKIPQNIPGVDTAKMNETLSVMVKNYEAARDEAAKKKANGESLDAGIAPHNSTSPATGGSTSPIHPAAGQAPAPAEGTSPSGATYQSGGGAAKSTGVAREVYVLDGSKGVINEQTFGGKKPSKVEPGKIDPMRPEIKPETPKTEPAKAESNPKAPASTGAKWSETLVNANQGAKEMEFPKQGQNPQNGTAPTH